MKEVWKPVKGFENKYLVSNLGRFFSLYKNAIMKMQQDKDGYLLICLNNKTRRAHRIVADTFIDNTENYSQINHINGVKSDNRVENLEWCNQSYNMKHRFEKLGVVPYNKGKHMSTKQRKYLSRLKKGKNRLGKNSNAKKVMCIETKEVFNSTIEADIKLGVAKGCVAHCAKGNTKTAGGLHWQYL